MKYTKHLQAFFSGAMVASTICLIIHPDFISWIAAAATFGICLSNAISKIYIRIFESNGDK